MNRYKKIDRILGIIVSTALVLWSLYYIYDQRKLRKGEQIYVLGQVSKSGKSYTGGYFIKYSYYFDNQEYSNSMAVGFNPNLLNDARFIVEIPKGKPEHGLLLLNCKVEDPELISPSLGWKDNPLNCN